MESPETQISPDYNQTRPNDTPEGGVRHQVFVVNVYDSLSLDIDVPLAAIPESARVYSSEYQFKDENGITTSRAYRFRLQGISVRPYALKSLKKRLQESHLYVRTCILDTDGWITAKIHGVDTYCRLLGDIAIQRNPLIEDLGSHLKERYPDLFMDYR